MVSLFEKHKAEFREELLKQFDAQVTTYMDLDRFEDVLPQAPPAPARKASARKRRPSRNATKQRASGRKQMSRELADQIRKTLGKHRKNSKARKEGREQLMKQHGLTPRQISGAEFGLERAKKRRKK